MKPKLPLSACKYFCLRQFFWHWTLYWQWNQNSALSISNTRLSTFIYYAKNPGHTQQQQRCNMARRKTQDCSLIYTLLNGTKIQNNIQSVNVLEAVKHAIHKRIPLCPKCITKEIGQCTDCSVKSTCKKHDMTSLRKKIWKIFKSFGWRRIRTSESESLLTYVQHGTDDVTSSCWMQGAHRRLHSIWTWLKLFCYPSSKFDWLYTKLEREKKIRKQDLKSSMIWNQSHPPQSVDFALTDHNALKRQLAVWNRWVGVVPKELVTKLPLCMVWQAHWAQWGPGRPPSDVMIWFSCGAWMQHICWWTFIMSYLIICWAIQVKWLWKCNTRLWRQH